MFPILNRSSLLQFCRKLQEVFMIDMLIRMHFTEVASMSSSTVVIFVKFPEWQTRFWI